MNLRLAYLLVEWPRYSETFLMNELLALRSYGQPIRIFCLRENESHSIPPEFSDRVEFLSSSAGDVNLSLIELLGLLSHRSRSFRKHLERAYTRLLSPESIDEAKRRELFLALACAVQLRARCRKLKITHVHAHYANFPTQVAQISRELGGPNYSFTGHAKDIFTMEPNRLASRIGDAEFAITCSKAGQTTLVKAARHQSDHIYCVYHGINNADWQIDRDPETSHLNIISVGRLTPKKGFFTLVQALAELRRRGIDAHVEIIGEGREREQILALARQLDVADFLNLPGKMPQPEIRARFRTSTVFVLPSIVLPSNNQDGIANAVVEAMAAGMPVIVSSIPALRELVADGETGLVFEAGNSHALAEKLSRINGNRPLQERLGANARSRATQLDCANAATQLMKLFTRYAARNA